MNTPTRRYKKYILLAPALRERKMSLGKKILLTLVMLTIIVGFTRGSLQVGAPEAMAEETVSTDTMDLSPCLKLAKGQYFCGDDAGTDSKLVELYNENVKLKSRTKKATISFYTSEARQTDASPEIAANGKNIWTLYKQGIKTCASNDYKLGTKLTIEGLGDCIVNDRMNSRYTGQNRIDWYLGYSHDEAWKMGIKKNVTVIIN
jgi:3D (Asp-Asp-Asp) domain-containing protein